MQLPKDIDLAIVAPFPSRDRILEGWMSRISAIDAIFAGSRRIYLHIADHHRADGDARLIQHGDNSWEACFSPHEGVHQQLVDQIISSVSCVYIHTIHLAEWLVPWLNTGKLIVDFHGIVPEEEIMMGRPELAPRYARVEEAVLRNARGCVMVTAAMRQHFREKYPAIVPSVIVLPIVENIDSLSTIKSGATDYPVKAIYAGGTQAWQNLDAMLQMAKQAEGFASFSFLSHDWQLIEGRGRILGAPSGTKYRFCPKADLPQAYSQADFGLVLRDNTAVNRVACPTKLYEYLVYGLVPVVRSPALGDFEDLGYVYVKEEEFVSGFLPDSNSRKWMIKKNHEASLELKTRFKQGANELIRVVGE